MLNLSKENFESTIAEGVAIVDFWAEWCGYCRMLAPVMDELADKHGGAVKVAKVNIDEEGELSASYGITSLPTIIAFKDGKEIERKMGAQPIEVLKGMIFSHIS